jgi:hypothetical protein
VQEIPFGFQLIGAGEQITHRAIAFWLWLARFGIFRSHFHLQRESVYRRSARRAANRNSYVCRRDRPLAGRPDSRGERVRAIDLRDFAKAKPSRGAHRACSQPVGESETRGNFRCLSSTGSACGSDARTSSEDC